MNLEDIKYLENEMFIRYKKNKFNFKDIDNIFPNNFISAFDLLWIPISNHTFNLDFTKVALENIGKSIWSLILLPMAVYKIDECSILGKLLLLICLELIFSMLLIAHIASFLLSMITRPLATTYYLFKSPAENKLIPDDEYEYEYENEYNEDSNLKNIYNVISL